MASALSARTAMASRVAAPAKPVARRAAVAAR
jgi:hypothetical protein